MTVVRWLAFAIFFAAIPIEASACPFCRAVSETISDKLTIADVVVIARSAETPAKPAAKSARKQAYQVIQILKDKQSHLGEVRRIKAPRLADVETDAKFVILGAWEKDIREIYWLSPRVVSARAIEYLNKLPSAPSKDSPAKDSSADRLAFFQEYLNDQDDFIADDAYDEFARASYAEVKGLGPRMHREKLLAWVQDKSVPAMRRRQFFTMLCVCGRKEDVGVLKKLVLEETSGPGGALDAAVACYLTITAADGLAFIENHFIKNTKASRSDGRAVAMALRFHGEEGKVIPRSRLLKTLRLYLDRPRWADQVMAELSRWEDRSLVERMAKLFNEAEQTTESKFAALALRVPIVKYLRANPLPEAKRRLAELEETHPEVVRAADIYPFLPSASKSAQEKSAAKKKVKSKQLPSKTSAESNRPTKAIAVKKPADKEYPVLLTGISLLGTLLVLLGLLMVILFGFRARTIE